MFTCKFCDFQTDTLHEKLHHAILNRNISRGHHCDFNKCTRVCDTEISLRVHLIRDHNYKAMEGAYNTPGHVDLATLKLNCGVEICQKKCDTYLELRRHLKDHLLEGTKVPCPFSPCNQIYSNEVSLRSHISKHHRSAQLTDCAQGLQMNAGDGLPEMMDTDDFDGNIGIGEGGLVHQMGQVCSADSFAQSVALFYLKLEAQHLISASTVQNIVEEIKEVSELSKRALKEQLRIQLSVKLKEFNLSQNDISDVVNGVCDYSNLSLYHEDLSSIYLRKQFYKNNLHYVEPKEYVFLNENGTKSDRLFHYVNLLDTLKAMLTDKNVKDQYQNPSCHAPNLLRDFHDGSVYKKNQLFAIECNGVEIILFMDAFVVVNPLGAARKKYKILGVYLMLGNCDSSWRSLHSNIQLVALCKEEWLDHEQFYKPLVEDLCKLESDGIEISPGETVKGTVVFIAGDNLGSNGVGGFVENFSHAEFYCRFCLMSRRDFVPDFTFYARRSVLNYNEALANPTEAKGVKFDSLFNSLRHYHVTMGLPSCLAHDLFEGIIAYDLALCLNNLIAKKWFKVDELNSSIDTFKYSAKDRRDRPVNFSDKFEKIGGSASQIWAFIRLLPLILANCIRDAHDEVWKFVLLMREIVLLATSPVVRPSCLPYFEAQILDYLDLRITLFPGKLLRPKHHFLMHYPELTVEFGPLIKAWTLRFESKHAFFKRVARACQNFINITRTLSEKHELFQSYQRAGASDKPPLIFTKEKPFQPTLYNEEIQSSVTFITNTPVVECVKATVTGTEYKSGDVVILSQGSTMNDLSLGKISIVLVDSKQVVYLVVEEKIIEHYPVIQAFMLGKTLRFSCIALTDLVDYLPLPIYKLGTKSCVVLKHGVMLWQ